MKSREAEGGASDAAVLLSFFVLSICFPCFLLLTVLPSCLSSSVSRLSLIFLLLSWIECCWNVSSALLWIPRVAAFGNDPAEIFVSDGSMHGSQRGDMGGSVVWGENLTLQLVLLTLVCMTLVSFLSLLLPLFFVVGVCVVLSGTVCVWVSEILVPKFSSLMSASPMCPCVQSVPLEGKRFWLTPLPVCSFCVGSLCRSVCSAKC
jgi:hypothetical protein